MFSCDRSPIYNLDQLLSYAQPYPTDFVLSDVKSNEYESAD